MKNIVNVFVVILLVGGVSSFSSVQDLSEAHVVQTGEWERLGVRKVNMGADHDVIRVTASKGFITKLKFKVLDAPILVRNVKVVFGNGTSKNVKISKRIAAGEESRLIDLPGNKRVINKIIISYSSIAKQKGEATIVVFGKH